MGISEYLEKVKEESDDRYDKFAIEPIGSRGVEFISEDAYLEKPIWLGGDEEYVCLFIDLDDSSRLSFKKHPKTMAKIYDYFTQNIINMMSVGSIKANYIDIKGDGAFGIYEGKDAVFRALCCAVTFKTFFDKYVRSKFQTEDDIINCKLAIDMDKILVRKLGKKGDKNNNEVWAGRVVNNTSKIASLSKKIYESNQILNREKRCLLMISEKVHKLLLSKKDYATMSCGCDESGNVSPRSAVWSEYDCSANDSVNCEKVYYTAAMWCNTHGNEFMRGILK